MPENWQIYRSSMPTVIFGVFIPDGLYIHDTDKPSTVQSSYLEYKAAG